MILKAHNTCFCFDKVRIFSVDRAFVIRMDLNEVSMDLFSASCDIHVLSKLDKKINMFIVNTVDGWIKR